ncbi:pantoate--beta-alanine ligase [Trueperella sp. LYQ141]|uniref:pantoate--beta-alanine ligase n=1 Tax=Trueperella sp. LYQ141 TaxID=3391058 RepID=UPI003983C279
MEICTTRGELTQALASHHGTRALVMTMGALHEGHASLMRQARQAAEVLIVSIYVNPLQFGPHEDFSAYPRPREADLAVCEAENVDIVFMPTDEQMYPHPPLVRIDPGPMATVLEGATRPGHFAGVLQIVHKVFQLTAPDVAFFGQKDAQQLALIRTMVDDLNMPVEIRAVPIARDDDGLALSSRNTYLSAAQREQALAISAALRAGVVAGQREGTAGAARTAARKYLAHAPGVRVDYVHAVDPQTFAQRDPESTEPTLLVAAAWVGETRLIDNMEVDL